MFHQKLIGLVIVISLCLIQSAGNPLQPYENQRFTTCAWEHQATCDVRKSSGKWVCDNQWVCAGEWVVRNDAGECIQVWKCPKICPPNSEFNMCHKDITAVSKVEVNEFEKLCHPLCSCKEGYKLAPIIRRCIPQLAHEFMSVKG